MREGIGNRAPVGTPKQHEQAIPQCGKRMCGSSLRRMPGIFAKRHIAHIMQPILNRPMAAPQPLRSSPLRPPLASCSPAHTSPHSCVCPS